MSGFFTPAEDQTITEKAKAGSTDREIAAALGRSRHSISTRRRSLCVSPLNNRSAWSEADEAQLLEMKGSGATLLELSKVLGRTPQNISKKLERMEARSAAGLRPSKRCRPLGSTKRPPSYMAVALLAEIAKFEENIAELTSTLEMMRVLHGHIGASA